MSATEAMTTPQQSVPTSNERRSGDRRRKPTTVFSRYAWFGGRRKGDRRGAATNGGYVDLYEPWLAAMLVAVGLLCALDAVFTLVYIQRGGSEANPIMAPVIDWGPRPFILFKCGITNAGLVILCLHKNHRWVRYVIGSLLIAYVALFLYHLYLHAAVG